MKRSTFTFPTLSDKSHEFFNVGLISTPEISIFCKNIMGPYGEWGRFDM